jgi:hypothetical protein
MTPPPAVDLKSAIGFDPANPTRTVSESSLIEYANLKLAAIGAPIFGSASDYPLLKLAQPLLVNYQEQARQLDGQPCAVDKRIQAYLDSYLHDVCPAGAPALPRRTLVLDRHGLARLISLPPDRDKFESSILSSYRIRQGVLHNPRSDRRTTQGVFHVCEGGLPIQGDKLPVPKLTYARLLEAALNPPEDLMKLPFTGSQDAQARLWVSLLLRPLVVPEIPGTTRAQTMEVRFFAPGNLVSNLDFVESIFGNAGHPALNENDAALDPEGWTGHTGCVILAPHLVQCTKKSLGLPHYDEAPAHLRKAGMCWKDPAELYNNGSAFKVTCRDRRGVVVTIIADNYYGYCKKEVKTQISYAANLYGQAEEEHAGGAIAFPSYDLGEDFKLTELDPELSHSFDGLVKAYGPNLDVHPEGYALDKKYPDICYVPRDAFFSLREQSITWTYNGKAQSLRLRPGITYMMPSGYKIEMLRPRDDRRWRLIGTTAEGTFCHKPCTVSGGGKSEISKSLFDAIIYGPVIVADFNRDLDQVDAIINKDYGMRFFQDAPTNKPAGRPLLSPNRSLGSVIKLLSPSPEYTEKYNAWLATIPYYIKELVFIVKRVYKAEWGTDWRSHFHVDLINGAPGYELKYRNGKLATQYLRIGFTEDGSWRTFGLRKDFFPSRKIQTEDDITASVTVPRRLLKGLNPLYRHHSVKFAVNCEYRLFQRPDDAVIRGYDKATESDLSQPGNFISNFEPLTHAAVKEMADDTIHFNQFTPPMYHLLEGFLAEGKPAYTVSSANPRLVGGNPSKNPRYLQDRQDLSRPRDYYLAHLGARLYRRIPAAEPVRFPVNAVLAGRRNNPPEEGVRPLCVYGPIHYFELPELFMEFISSMTGKSPSTTGAGSEGALTKAPFNALCAITDLNNAFVSYAISDYDGWVTSAGHIGPKYRVDHDISLLVPEVWSRMRPDEREPQHLLREGTLERCRDFVHEGKTVLAGRLGYRITEKFVREYFARIFANPGSVFNEEMLKPELQDPAIFAESMEVIVETHRYAAMQYLDDGSIAGACPPLRILLQIMAHGQYEGKTLDDPGIRALFTRDAVLGSDWYKQRLLARQKVETAHLKSGIASIEAFLAKPSHTEVATSLGLTDRLQSCRDALKTVEAPAYVDSLVGTLGTDPWVVGT